MTNPELNNIKPCWETLYKMGAFSSFSVCAIIIFQMIVFILYPLPDNIIGWFNLFRENTIIGLLDMDLFMMIDILLICIIMFSLWAHLKQTNLVISSLALLLQVICTGIYFSSTIAVEMMYTSQNYFAAQTGMDKQMFIIAGQQLLSTWQGTSFHFSYVIGGVVLILISWAMLKSDSFSGVIGYMGLTAGILGLIPPTLGKIGMFLSLLSILPLFIFLIAAGIILLKLSFLKRS